MADPTTNSSTSSITPTLSTATPARTGEQSEAATTATATAGASGVDEAWTGIGPAGNSGGGSDSSSSDGGQNAIKFILPVIGVLIGIFFLICVVRLSTSCIFSSPLSPVPPAIPHPHSCGDSCVTANLVKTDHTVHLPPLIHQTPASSPPSVRRRVARQYGRAR